MSVEQESVSPDGSASEGLRAAPVVPAIYVERATEVLAASGTLLALLALGDLAVRAALRLELRWDTFLYHLPFAALRGGLPIPYDMNDLMRDRYEGFPLLADLVQGALWRLTGSINATGVVNYLAFVAFLVYCHFALRARFWLVALIALTAPMVVIHTTVSYVDLFGNSLLAIGMSSCLHLYLFPERRARAVLLGGLTGLIGAAWTKFNLVPVVGLGLCLCLAVSLRRPLREALSKRRVVLGVAAGDVAVAEVLADDRAVLALDEGVVVGVSGSGLGELVDVEGFEQRGDGAVDVFRAVVGVKAVEGEGEGSEQGAEDRRQARGMEVLDRADALELGDLVHQVHVVQAFQVIQIGLVDGIDPDIAGAPERRRPTALANGDLDWARPGGGGSAAPLIRGRVPQVVEVAGGDAGQAFEPAVAKAMVGARTELARGRPGQGAVEPVELGEKPDVDARVAAGARPSGRPAAVGDAPGDPLLGQQPGELGARQPGHLGQKTSKQTLLSLPLVDDSRTGPGSAR